VRSVQVNALDLSVIPQVSISNLKRITLGPFPISIPPTTTINIDWCDTACYRLNRFIFGVRVVTCQSSAIAPRVRREGLPLHAS